MSASSEAGYVGAPLIRISNPRARLDRLGIRLAVAQFQAEGVLIGLIGQFQQRT
jgi:hypothetical protein